MSQAPEKLHRGDKVMLKMIDGPTKKVKIQQVTNEALVDTEGRYYDYRDMRGISRKKVSVSKTGTTIVGTTASVSAMAATTAVGFLLPVLGLGLSLGLILLV